jgi:hypothetical protein
MSDEDRSGEFDKRLQQLQRNRAPEREELLSIVAYERLRTARAIARSLLDKPITNADVLAVYAGMCGMLGATGTQEAVPRDEE